MTKYIRRHSFFLIILVILGLIGTRALLKPGFYTNHDGEHQLIRQYVFDRAIKSGHFPPRFDRQLMNGLGYPLFTFTYQLPFWLGQALMILGFSVPSAIKGVFILTFIASGIAMYIFAQDRWGKFAGFISAFLYLWAPYRFLTIFVRASLGEHTALVFLPLLFWSVNKTKNQHLRIFVGAVSVFGILLSHSMVAQMISLPFALFILLRLYEETKKAKLIKQLVFTAVLGLGLSAFYIIPAYYYQNAIQGLNTSFYSEHFVTLNQLVYSKWGYGFSVHGTNDGLSFQVGIAQWLIVALALFATVFKLLKEKKLPLLKLLFLGIFSLAIFFMTDASAKIWQKAVEYIVIDIPWRLLAITTFTSAILAAAFTKHLKYPLYKVGLGAIVFIIAIYTNRNHLRVNKYVNFDANWYKNYIGTSNSYNEYKPGRLDETLLEKQEKFSEFTLLSGQANTDIEINQPHQLTLNTEVAQTASLRLNTVYFPGWQLYINDQKQDIIASLDQGLVKVILNSGNYHIRLIYEQTPIMKLTNALSIISFLLLIGLIIKKPAHETT